MEQVLHYVAYAPRPAIIHDLIPTAGEKIQLPQEHYKHWGSHIAESSEAPQHRSGMNRPHLYLLHVYTCVTVCQRVASRHPTYKHWGSHIAESSEAPQHRSGMNRPHLYLLHVYTCVTLCQRVASRHPTRVRSTSVAASLGSVH